MSTVAFNFLEAAIGEENWSKALAALAEAFGATEAHFTVWDRPRSQLQFSAFAGRFPADKVDQYARYFCAVDTCRESLIWLPPGQIILTQKHCQDIFFRSEIYNDFLRPLGTRYLMAAKLTDSGSAVSMLRIHRSTRNGPYAEDQVRKFALLFPGLAHAAQYYCDQNHILKKAAVALTTLDQLEIGVIVVNSARHILQINAAAENLLDNNKGLLIIRNGKLLAKCVESDVAIRKAVEIACKGASTVEQNSCPARSIEQIDGVEISVSPLRPAKRGSVGTTTDAAMITLRKIENTFDHLSIDLTTKYALTRREAAIAEQIARGCTIQQITFQNSISTNTVKTHLKAIFSKMGIRSKSELVRAALGHQ